MSAPMLRLLKYPANGPRSMLPVWTILVLCVAVEAVLVLGDLGLVGPPRLRSLAYEAGAFWPGLLADWRPNYAVQPWLMFITYAFLHGGLLHLVLNMITLASLGAAVTDRIGSWGFLLVYALSAVAGGAAYGLLAVAATPMVGASGSLFGLAGALVAWIWKDQPSLKSAVRTVGRILALLVALNVAMYLFFEGRLAWATHLGGFVAGWIVGLALDPFGSVR